MKEFRENKEKSSYRTLGTYGTPISKKYFNNMCNQVRKSDATKEQMKELTVGVLDAVSLRPDPRIMYEIAVAFENWNKDASLAWRSQIIAYAKTHEEINNIYIQKSDDGNRLLVITKDIDLSTRMEYVSYCFGLHDKFADIVDFTVYDQEEYSGMKDFFDKYSMIFSRG